MIVVALVAAAAVAHAAWNLAIKRAGSTGVGFLWLAFAAGAVLYAPVGIASLVAERVDPLRLLPLALVSGLLQLGYFLLLQRGYRLGDVSVVYPLARGTGPLLSVLLAILIFGEAPTWFGVIGAFVVVAGVVVIGLAGGSAGARPNRPGILYGLAVGVLIAGYTIWDAHAVLDERMPPVGYYWASLVVQAMVFAIPALRRPAETWRVARYRPWEIVVVALLSPLAYVLILLAFQLAPVSLVAPAREISVVLVTLGGWLLFREPHPARRLAGAAIVLVGVGLLAVA
jgi:drug/metabolite transporter (DMT)-like permease